MAQIPGIYVEIKGDSTQLAKDMRQAKQIVSESAKGMSNALNNALSGSQISKGTNQLINSLGQLERASKNSGQVFKQIGVDLGSLQRVAGVTGSQFQQLQSKMLATAGARAQEKALKDIAHAADLTEREIKELGRQFGLSHSQINKVLGVSTKSASAMSNLGVATQSTSSGLRSMLMTMATLTGGFVAFDSAIRGVFGEFKRGLSSVEDFNVNVASSTALITTFSQKAQSGDLAGAFKDANEYAGQLAAKLEMIDSKTIASGKDLQTMSETMLQYGVLLDINNQKQIDGFTNIATALKLVTAGQNQEIQMRQEINSLLMGQIRATDRLPKLLSRIDPELESHLKLWKEEGTLIENVGELLKGFSGDVGDLDDLWMTVGSTMETIHNRVLRGAFKPMFEDLVGMAKDLNKSLMDAEGNLTPLAKKIQNDINGAYETGKELVKEYGDEVATFAGYIALAKTGQYLFNAAVKANPYVVAATGLMALNEQLKNFNFSLGLLDGADLSINNIAKSYDAMTDSISAAISGTERLYDPKTGGFIEKQVSAYEQAVGRINEIQSKLAGEKKWYEFQLFSDPEGEKRHIAELKNELSELQSQLGNIKDSENELSRERQRSGGQYKTQVVELAKTVTEESEKEIKARESAIEKQKKLIEEIEEKTKESTLSSLDYKKWVLEKEVKEMIKNANGNKKILDDIAEYKRQQLLKMTTYEERYNSWERANLEKMKDSWQQLAEGKADADARAADMIKDNAKKTTNVIIDEWSNAFESIQSALADMIYEFDFSMDNILDIFKRMLAEMLAAIAMSGIKDAFLGLFGKGEGLFSGLVSGVKSIFGGEGGASGGAGGLLGALGLAGVGSKIGSWLGFGSVAPAATTGAAAGATALAGGAVSASAPAAASGSGFSLSSLFGGGGGASMGSFATAGAALAGVGAIIGIAMSLNEQLPALNEQLNSMRVTAQQITATGLSTEMQQLDSSIREMVPALHEVSMASWDASTATLKARSGMDMWAESMESGNKTIVEATYQYDQLTGTWSSSLSVIDSYRQSLYDSMLAANQAADAVSGMGDATAQAARQIAGAADSIGSILDSARQTMVTAGMDGASYHADGGIFTGKTRWGNHVIAESGAEGLVPLPEGPGTLSNIIDRLDRIEANGSGVPSIRVFIGDTELKGLVRVEADRLDADRDPQQRGRRYPG